MKQDLNLIVENILFEQCDLSAKSFKTILNIYLKILHYKMNKSQNGFRYNKLYPVNRQELSRHLSSESKIHNKCILKFNSQLESIR